MNALKNGTVHRVDCDSETTMCQCDAADMTITQAPVTCPHCIAMAELHGIELDKPKHKGVWVEYSESDLCVEIRRLRSVSPQAFALIAELWGVCKSDVDKMQMELRKHVKDCGHPLNLAGTLAYCQLNHPETTPVRMDLTPPNMSDTQFRKEYRSGCTCAGVNRKAVISDAGIEKRKEGRVK